MQDAEALRACLLDGLWAAVQGPGTPEMVAAQVHGMHPLQFSRHGAIKDQSIPALDSSLHLHTSAGWVGAVICNFTLPILPLASINACLRPAARQGMSPV